MSKKHTRREYMFVVTVFMMGCLGVTQNISAQSENTGLSISKEFFIVRGGLENCRSRFITGKTGRVAFLGGSITTMPGWRDLTCEMLKKRFPDTKFEFINAGIGGTNSTLGALRFEQDVFGKGRVDLLFLEFAVNDSGNESPDNRSARAMEGIIRHALRLNPAIDILVQYFVDTDKAEEIRKGKMPDVILRHDRVAEHYGIPIINMATEMTRRIDAGEFTWQQFSGDTCHPSPFGHERYAECIGKFLDAAWANPLAQGASPKDHVIPEPLDRLNYEYGRFIDLDQAKVLNGWNRNKQWDTEKKCNYGGAVDVLAAEAPGATLELAFEGTLIGVSEIAGMDAGIMECSVDGKAPVSLDFYDHYCEMFHRPVCRILAEDLAPGKHVATLRMAQDKNLKSQGHAARILKFATNGPLK
ncbi:MAG TPA: GDSL-type esterase/lipase family protein [Candidatus Hydrogenedentes bacterium]|nr:GDSL-type esterase/lipase family protein [Candidatus Hydrogenedentota bacterium]